MIVIRKPQRERYRWFVRDTQGMTGSMSPTMLRNRGRSPGSLVAGLSAGDAQGVLGQDKGCLERSVAMAKVTVKIVVQQRGGKKLRRLLREAGKGGVSGVKVVVLLDGQVRAMAPLWLRIAAWNEFGTETIPERPFFRNALADV